MTRRAAAAANVGSEIAPPRILKALALRETGHGAPLLVLLATASAAAAGYAAYGPGGGGGPPLLDRMLRRFDLTVLAGAVILLVLRSAANIEADHRDGWLPAFLAAGGVRWHYGAACLLAAIMIPVAMFLAAAVTFAATVAGLTSSPELLRVLPRTIGGGLLVVGSWAVCAVAVGLVARRASIVAGVVALIVAAPSMLLMRYVFREEAAPLWVLLIQLLSPLPVPPADALNAARALVYIVFIAGLTMLLSYRYAGRSG